MEKNVRMAILFDYYGDMLTEKQKEYFDLYYNENLSLAEIAENDGISRQGVRDIIVRAEAILVDFENKLGMVRREERFSKALGDISALTEEISHLNSVRFKNGRLLELCKAIDGTLRQLKTDTEPREDTYGI